jgi:hypothetical protein
MAAYNNPGFYCQLGQDACQIVGNAIETLARRFNLH